MDLQTRKLELIRIFLNLQNEDIIGRIENLLKKDKKSILSLNESINPFSIDDLNLRIDKSLEDSKRGNLTAVSDLISDIEKWN